MEDVNMCIDVLIVDILTSVDCLNVVPFVSLMGFSGMIVDISDVCMATSFVELFLVRVYTWVVCVCVFVKRVGTSVTVLVSVDSFLAFVVISAVFVDILEVK